MELKALVQKQNMETPFYYFDIDEFRRRICYVKQELVSVPLTFSIKANPFLLSELPDEISHVEVCSPGELQICKRNQIPGSRIIYSGVNKQEADVTDAVQYRVDIATAESLLHVELEQKAAKRLKKTQKVILRMTSGNQFGMSQEELLQILLNKEQYPNLDFYGIHYYSGTQKKLRQVKKDFQRLEDFLKLAEREVHFIPRLVEMGLGLSVDYFGDCPEEKEQQYLQECLSDIRAFAEKYPLGLEMGRYLAASCGTYATRVKDIKTNDEINYVICDGGIHQLRYYGQNMAMQVPEIEVSSESAEMVTYCICGSLCTVADVLVRETELPRLQKDDILFFKRCGAYSVTEGSAMFLSRELPAVYIQSGKSGTRKLRDVVQTADFNSSDPE